MLAPPAPEGRALGVADPEAERVQPVLGLRRDRSSGTERHQRCARESLAFSTTPLRLPCRDGQADVHPDAVELGHGGEGCGDPAGAGAVDRGHPVEPPTLDDAFIPSLIPIGQHGRLPVICSVAEFLVSVCPGQIGAAV